MRWCGVVVAITTLRPASWCCAMRILANGPIWSTSDCAARRAASSNAPPGLPAATNTAWRASAIEPSVSPNAFIHQKSTDSPGNFELTTPLSRIARDRAGPDAFRRSVRSRSKKAAPAMTRG